jgi:hypothetical protein
VPSANNARFSTFKPITFLAVAGAAHQLKILDSVVAAERKGKHMVEFEEGC